MQALKTNNLCPLGTRISVDHFHYKPLGQLITLFGKEKSTDKYKGGCLFVDYASNPIDVLAKDIISLDKPSPSDLRS